ISFLYLHVRTELPDPDGAGKPLEPHGGCLTWIDLGFDLRHLLFETLRSEEEVSQIRQPGRLAAGDLVQLLLHTRGEPGVHERREITFEQSGNRESGECRDQLIALQLDITAIDN